MGTFANAVTNSLKQLVANGKQHGNNRGNNHAKYSHVRVLL